MNSKSLTKKLLANTSNYGMGTVLPKIIGFLLIPIYTAYLAPEDYGIVDICTTVTVFLLMVYKFGLPGSISRLYFDYQDDIKTYISTIFWFLLLVSIGLFLATLFIGKLFLEDIIPSLPYKPFFLLVAATAFVQVFSVMQRQIIIVREQSQYSAKLSIVVALVTIGLILIFVVGLGMKALGFVLGGLIGSTLIFFQVLYYLRHDIRFSFKWSYIIPSLLWGMSVFPSHLMNYFSPLLSKTLLINYQNMSSLGLVSIAIRFVSPLFIIITAFKNAYLPVYYSYRREGIAENINKLIKMSKNIWILSCVLFLCVVLLFPPLIRLITPDSYHLASGLIWILAFGFLFKTIWILFGLEIFYSKKTYWHPIISFIAILSNLGFMFLFVKTLGMYAVAIGMTLFWGVYVITGVFISRKIYSPPTDIRFYVFSFLLTLISFSFYWIFEFFSFNDYLNLSACVLVISVFGFYYKNKLGISLRSIL